MGGCVSRDRNTRRRYRRPYSFRSSVTTTNGFVGRNKPLNPPACHPKWKSDVPITDNQLRRKREEYWDTAPAFEGRKEIWDALRGTCYAIEQNDIDLAQSILNCANISLPHGTLLDCYDELGTRYQLPVYVLSSPINLIDGERASMDSRADYESGTSDAGLTITVNTDRDRDYGGNQSSSSSSTMTQTQPSTTRRQIDERHNPILRRIKKHRQKHKSNIESGHETVLVQHQEQTIVEIPIKYRLSNGNEHRLYCKQNEKFRAIKKRLALLENGAIDSQVQRFFFGGKLLRDRATISETRLQRNFVVQVILYEQSTVPEATIAKTGELTIHDELTNQSYSTPNDSPNTTFNL